METDELVGGLEAKASSCGGGGRLWPVGLALLVHTEERGVTEAAALAWP